MKIAITGGAGVIGSRLATAYLDAGHTVIIIDNLTYGPDQLKQLDQRARFYQLDIRDRRLTTIFQHERPDIVSHHVAYQHENDTCSADQGHALDQADILIHGVLNVLDSCIDAGVKKFILASGGNDLYAPANSNLLPAHPYRESDPLWPHTAQDIGKVACEWYVRYYTQQYRLDHSILRYADVYGESQIYAQRPPHPITAIIHALQHQQRPVICNTGSAIRDHIFIDDVVSANTALIHHGRNQTFNISSGLGVTTTQLYQQIRHALENNLEPFYIPTTPPIHSAITAYEQWEDDLREEAPALVLDNTKAHQLLRWHERTTLAEGIIQAIRRLNMQTANTPLEQAEAKAHALVAAMTTPSHA